MYDDPRTPAMTTIDINTIAAERIALTNSQASFRLSFCQILGKDGYECCADGSFADEPAKHVGDPERDRVSIGQVSGAKKRCDPLVANVSKYPADNGKRADRRRRLEHTAVFAHQRKSVPLETSSLPEVAS